jgi:hypothetical protein
MSTPNTRTPSTWNLRAFGFVYASHARLAWTALRRDKQFRSALAFRDIIEQPRACSWSASTSMRSRRSPRLKRLPTSASKRVLPAERLRAEIEGCSSGGEDLSRAIEQVAQLGARLLLQSALQAEVTTALGRERYQRAGACEDARVGMCNGYCPVTIKTTAVLPQTSLVLEGSYVRLLLRRRWDTTRWCCAGINSPTGETPQCWTR